MLSGTSCPKQPRQPLHRAARQASHAPPIPLGQSRSTIGFPWQLRQVLSTSTQDVSKSVDGQADGWVFFPCPAPPTACVVRRRKKSAAGMYRSTHPLAHNKEREKNTAAGAPPGIDKGTWELGCSLTVSEAAKHLPPLCLVPFSPPRKGTCVWESEPFV